MQLVIREGVDYHMTVMSEMDIRVVRPLRRKEARMPARLVFTAWALIASTATFAATAVAEEAASASRPSSTAAAAHEASPPPTVSPVAASPVVAPSTTTQTGASAVSGPSGPDYRKLFRPVFQPAVLVWFGGLLWLMLATDFRQFWSLRTVDVVAIVALSVLFQFRQDDRTVTVANADVSYAFIAWTGMFVVCAYLFLRTLGQLLRRAARETPTPGIGAGAWIFLAFVVSMNFCSLPAADVGEAATRAVVGGEYLRATGMLPYGQIGPGEMSGPLLYTLTAADWTRVTRLPHAIGGPESRSTSGERAGGQSPAAASPDLKAAKRISGVAHALLLLGIVMLGWQYHSAATGALLAALYGILPPVVGDLAMPNMTVPAALIVWALITASPKTKALGAAISGVLLMVAAGVALYPGLLVPAWFGYFLRRRPSDAAIEEIRSARPASELAADEIPGALPRRRRRDFSTLAFVLACVVAGASIKWYALQRTAPMPPRGDGILAAIGRGAAVGTHELTITDGVWQLSPIADTTERAVMTTESATTTALQWLAEDGSTGQGPRLSPELLQGIGKATWAQSDLPPPPSDWLRGQPDVPLCEIRPTNPEATRALRMMYRQATTAYPWWRRTVASGRTIFENTFIHEFHLVGERAFFAGHTTSRPTTATEADATGAWGQWKKRQRQVLHDEDANLSARSEARAQIKAITEEHQYVLAGHVALCLAMFLVMVIFKSRCTPWHLCVTSAALLAGVELWRMDGSGADVAWYIPLVMVALFAGRLPIAAMPARTITQPAPPTLEPSPYGFSKASAG